MTRMQKKIMVLILLLCGCTARQEQISVKPDPVLMAIRDHAEQIEKDLSLLSKIKQQQNKKILDQAKVHKVPRSKGFDNTISINWSGPVEPLIRMIADRVSYKFRISGKKPINPMLVNIRSIDQPVFKVLEEIGWQAGEKVGVVVDENSSTIQVVYVGLN